MKSAARCKLALVTAPDLTTARRLAKSALKARLIACANLVTGIESHYWWKGRVQSDSEVLLLLKTTTARLAKLEKLILDEHPYDTPEFLVVSLSRGNGGYLEWLASSCEGD